MSKRKQVLTPEHEFVLKTITHLVKGVGQGLIPTYSSKDSVSAVEAFTSFFKLVSPSLEGDKRKKAVEAARAAYFKAAGELVDMKLIVLFPRRTKKNRGYVVLYLKKDDPNIVLEQKTQDTLAKLGMV